MTFMKARPMTPDKNSSPPSDDDVTLNFPVVALGASAGGLAAMNDFFQELPDSTGMAFVVVQHLAPDQDSELAAILQRSTPMTVAQIKSSTPLLPNHVYVIPPNAVLSVQDRCVHLSKPSQDRRTHISIDHFFQSLAEDLREDAIVIVLSGTRSDGSRGVIAVKDRGGLAFAQSPEDAEYPSMPQSAIDTGRVDLILPALEIGRRLAAYSAGDFHEDFTPPRPDEEAPEGPYRGIIAQLHSATGHDFTHYKRSTLERRIHRRRQLLQLPDLQAYLDHLHENPRETLALFDEVLIGVTEFFRNPDAFQALQKEVILPLLEEKEKHFDVPLRIWIPACSTGEEVYSIAMLLWEEAQRRQIVADFKIFATDLDPQAIDQARRGIFSRASCSRLSPERRERFFTEQNGGFRVVKELRDRVLFAVHDILQDPPFARQHLISCRNLLIYLAPPAQRKVFEALHYALRDDGYLFLGASEFIGQSKDLFTPLNKHHRIYRPKSLDRNHFLFTDRITSGAIGEPFHKDSIASPKSRPAIDLDQLHQEALLAHFRPASLLIDRDYQILHISGDVSPYLRIPPGRPTADVFKSTHPKLRLPLRTAIIHAFEESRATTTSTIHLGDDQPIPSLRIFVQPLQGKHLSHNDLLLLVFEPRQDPRAHDALPLSSEDSPLQTVIEGLEKEIDSTRRDLDRTVERYEITTEELKTSNEELMTINEELQSTTEELETSKEELQSTNEELITVNEELSFKLIELDEVNNDLKNLLSATNIGTIFLDRKLNLRRFTAPLRDYFNILDADLGRPFAHVTHRLETETLVDDARQVLKDLRPIERVVPSRDQRWYIIRTLPYRTTDDRIDGVVLTFFDITDRQEVAAKLAESELLFRTVFESASDALFLFHLQNNEDPSPFTAVNEGACRRLGYSPLDLSRITLKDLIEPSSQDVQAYLTKLLDTGNAVAQVQFRTRTGALIDEEINSRLFSVSGEPTVLTVSRDITHQKAYEAGLLKAKKESDRLAELRASFLANMSHEIRTPLTSIIGVSQLLSKADLSQDQKKMVQLIRTSGRRLHQTLDSVLDISRIEAGEMHPRYQNFDVISQITEDVDLLRPLAVEKNLTLHFHSSCSELLFGTDPGFLNRIVYNLVENAIKFTREGMVSIYAEPLDDSLEITVSDTGIGISEDFLPHLFDKFKQASSGISRSFEGSGLGMALVKNLTELMGGSISVRSTKGKGTTFTVLIPEHNPDEDPEA